jgi:hypothetical protein
VATTHLTLATLIISTIELLTPHSTTLLGKLKVAQEVKKFPTFSGSET